MGNIDHYTIRSEMHDIDQDELRQYQANQTPPDDLSNDNEDENDAIDPEDPEESSP